MSSFIIIILSIIFSAFFSGMEIAFVSANKLRLEIDKKQSGFNSKILTTFSNNPSQFISTMLVGNNFALVIYGIFMAKLLEPVFFKIIDSSFAVLLLQTIVSTLIILFTAEFLPKTLFRIVNNSALKFFTWPLLIFYYMFYPIVKFAMWISKVLMQIFLGIKISQRTQEKAFGKLDIDYTLNELNEESESNDKLIENDLKIFQNALDFSEIKLRECMVPRTELCAFASTSSIDDIRQGFISSGFSRILIYKDTIDDIIGFVHILSVFKNPQKLKNIITPLIFVPETLPANKLLKQFIQENKSIAVVVDEFGGTAGIVTIEDIVEEIFGEIEDEHDFSELVSKQINKNEFIFSGRLEVDTINENFKIGLNENEEYETIAGYILYHYGDFPEKNQEIEIEENNRKFYFKIIKITDTRIDLVKLKF
ncbi:MAG TPA: hemolysin family protein [Bacteroidales bacterium]|jgi:CBS domain containing-hemolysin-like protein|nr:hemolysin family protein [Bacteroidales bacterium]MDD4235696.1 hemolysin family protein [Bacteroidales bacterium]MDY0160736.1 hemolysin family protein [Bacteroidales bacterium]HXK81273.1 hemolysin family protein [Bacteroidales bacterium]